MPLTENAIKVLEKRYLRGETPEEMFKRVATAVAAAEGPTEAPIWKKEFYYIMSELYFLPNSPTLMNAGRTLSQLAACFVLPIEDSMEGIFDAIKYMAMVQKSGGGTGFDFSKLRPAGQLVSSTIGEASGPLSFMRVFNAATEEIKQGGARRGANMAIMRIDHPDIEEFIRVKSDLTQLTNFNMSVAITDEFMYCLEKNIPFELKFNGTIYKEVNPADLWHMIVDRAWTTGEPGVVFIDEINRHNPTPGLGKMDSTNPCGEQPLLPFEACNLGSINLALMIKDGQIDYDLLKYVTYTAVRFLDNVIEINHYPLPQIEDIAKGNRKIGLGVMGWADLLFKLRIAYDSQEALDLAETVMQFINKVAHDASEDLAGVKDTYRNWWTQDSVRLQRNATCTTIAPTGTLSIIAGVSSGIEPLFGLSYVKELTDGGNLYFINDEVRQYIKEAIGTDLTDEGIKQALEQGKLSGSTIEGLELLKTVFKASHEIAPEWHVRMQAAFQKYTDNAVSKTINFNNTTTREDIANAIKLAYDLNCKGLTVYRDGSRESQPLSATEKKVAVEKATTTEFQRPERMPGFTTKARTGCGNMFVTVNHIDGEVKEVFLKAGGSGGCTAFTEALGRVISVGLKYGTPLEQIIDQVTSVRCDNFRHQTGRDTTLKGKSCPDVVGTILRDLQTQRVDIVTNRKNSDYTAAKCPECGMPLERAEGCIKCQCGYSRC